jgi:hypothetical protein
MSKVRTAASKLRQIDISKDMARVTGMDHLTGYLDKSPDSFQQLFAALAKVVKMVFPNAEKTFAYNMPGFRIKVSDKEIKDWKGTIDPNYLQIFLVQRKSGVTLHIWNALDYDGLDRKRDELTKAGFKVMRGCLQWNRKQAYPMKVVETLLNSIKGHPASQS